MSLARAAPARPALSATARSVSFRIGGFSLFAAVVILTRARARARARARSRGGRAKRRSPAPGAEAGTDAGAGQDDASATRQFLSRYFDISRMNSSSTPAAARRVNSLTDRFE